MDSTRRLAFNYLLYRECYHNNKDNLDVLKELKHHLSLLALYIRRKRLDKRRKPLSKFITYKMNLNDILREIAKLKYHLKNRIKYLQEVEDIEDVEEEEIFWIPNYKGI